MKPRSITGSVILVAALALLFASTRPSAQGTNPDLPRVAVLDFRNPAGLTDQEADYLTDLVRGVARAALPVARYIVMTKENIEAMLSPEQREALSRCSGEVCEVESGRMVGADYVATGEIVHFGRELKVSLKLHETHQGNLLNTLIVSGADVNALETPLKADARALFAPMTGRAAPAPGVADQRIGETPSGGWDAPTSDVEIVRFESDPAGAVVMMNGALLCQATPCSKEVAIGPANVSMQKERYLPFETTVTIAKAQPPVAVKLEPNFGWLTVTSEPPGLTVKVNGQDAGRTPLTDRDLDPGAYDVLVTDPRYYNQGERFTLDRGQRKTIAVTMPPREGAIKVSAQDSGGNAVKGDVYVDATKVGETPGTFEALVGVHEVEVRSASGSWSGKADVKEEKVTEVAVTVAGAGGPRGAERSRTGIEMILIQPGTFTMGSPTSEEGRDKRGNNETQHQVTISRSYYLGKTEVTQGMWKNIMGDNPSHFSSCGEECPVEKASWKETVEFCNKLSDREGLTRCYSDSSSNATWNQGCTGYRLPTEAEWEYAARAGTSTRFACGDDKSCLKELGWYLSTPGVGPRGPNGGVFPQTHPVGEKTANAWGLYDMHGNVWEWVWDWKAEYPGGPVTDPAGPSAGSDRVIRGGGSADYDGRGCRSANRNGRGPGDHVQFVGFRLARSAR